jgi:hypothetical protein
MLLHQGKNKNDLIYHGISKKGHKINDKHNKGKNKKLTAILITPTSIQKNICNSENQILDQFLFISRGYMFMLYLAPDLV